MNLFYSHFCIIKYINEVQSNYLLSINFLIIPKIIITIRKNKDYKYHHVHFNYYTSKAVGISRKIYSIIKWFWLYILNLIMKKSWFFMIQSKNPVSFIVQNKAVKIFLPSSILIKITKENTQTIFYLLIDERYYVSH